MKKTLTVNLGGIVFNIDEDAYQLLDNYLSNLRIHFSREEGSDEIMNDFESRISELLNDRIRLGFQVITIEHIEEVIKRMGKPEEIFAEDEERANAEKHTSQAEHSATAEKTKKRLMRDPDDCMLGGVASGFAAYWGCDVTALRLVLILLLFLPLPIPIVVIYLLLWMIIPVAKTATDKLRMRGESISIENIGKTVTDNFEKASNRVNDYIHSDKPRSTIQKVADFIVSVVGTLLKIVAALIGIILIPAFLLAVFILLVVVFALVIGGIGVGTAFIRIPFMDNMEFLSDIPLYVSVIGCIGGIFFLGIPLIALIYSLFKKPMNLKPMSSGAKWVWLILWVISLIVCILYGVILANSSFHEACFHISSIIQQAGGFLQGSVLQNALP